MWQKMSSLDLLFVADLPELHRIVANEAIKLTHMVPGSLLAMFSFSGEKILLTCCKEYSIQSWKEKNISDLALRNSGNSLCPHKPPASVYFFHSCKIISEDDHPGLSSHIRIKLL